MGQGHLRLYNGPWDRTILQSEATHQGFWQDWLTTGCVRGLSFVMCYFWCWSNQRSVLTIFRLPLCDVVVTDYDVKSDFMEHFFFYMYKLLASPDSWSLCIIYISIFMILFNMRPVTKRSQSVWSHPQWGHPDFYILVSTDELQDFDRLLVKKSCYYKFSTICTFTEQEKGQLFIVCKEYIPKCFLRKHSYMYFIFSNLIHIWFMQFYILWDKNLGNLGICLRC